MIKIHKILFSGLLVASIAAPALLVGSSCSSNATKLSTIPAGNDVGDYHTLSRDQYEQYYYTYQDDISFFNDVDGATYDKHGINLAAPIYPHGTHIYNNDMDQAKNNNGWWDLQGFATLVADENTQSTYANTYRDFFINPDVAAYFAGGRQYINGIVTTVKLKNFVEHNMHGILNLSGLYSSDYERDNSVMALLNPMLWNILLDRTTSFEAAYLSGSSYDNFTGSTFIGPLGDSHISYIDLSNNHLRNVPNWSSLKGPTRGLHFMTQKDTYVGTGYNRDYYSFEGYRYTAPLGEDTDPTFLDGINLEHNCLTYLNLNPAPSDDDDADAYTEIYVPGLASIVKPFRNWLFQSTGSDGLMLDYNYMPYIYSLKKYATYAKTGQSIWGELETAGVDLIDDSYFYINYSRVDGTTLLVDVLEMVLQLGCYQTDAVIITDQDLTNMMKAKFPADFRNRYIDDIIAYGNESICFDYFEKNNGWSQQTGQSWTSLIASKSGLASEFSRNLGRYIIVCRFDLSIDHYLPTNLDLSGGIADITNRILSLFDMHNSYCTNANVFKRNNIIFILNATIFSTMAASVISFYLIRIYLRKRDDKTRKNAFIAKRDKFSKDRKE